MVIRAMALTNMPVAKDMAAILSEDPKTKSHLFSNHSSMEKTEAEIKLSEELAEKETLLSEKDNEIKTLTEKVQLSEKKERESRITADVEQLFLSDENKVGFKAGQKDKIIAFALTLSDDQAKEYVELHKEVVTAITLGEDGGAGDAGEDTTASDDPNVEAEQKAVELAEKEKIPVTEAYKKVLLSDSKLAKRVDDAKGY